ncbi:MAG: periplasmic heavy metal sensor [Nitrospinota bacterium]
MKKRYVSALLLVVVILVIAFSAFYIVRDLDITVEVEHQNFSAPQHLYEALNITDEQKTILAHSEMKYQKQNQYLEEIMSLANMELANSIEKDKFYSENVQKSVDKIHKAMGEIQKATLEHLLEMQSILDDKQNEKLIELITDSLYENAHKRD